MPEKNSSADQADTEKVDDAVADEAVVDADGDVEAETPAKSKAAPVDEAVAEANRRAERKEAKERERAEKAAAKEKAKAAKAKAKGKSAKPGKPGKGPKKPGSKSRGWVAPVMLACWLLGLAWLVVYYIAGQDVPVMQDLGNWNLLIGMALIAVGFIVSTQWV